MLLRLQENYVYGPVRSRRLGNSLGINILPRKKKVCNFECVYCQYGWKITDGLEESTPEIFPEISDILLEVEKTLRALIPKPTYITFSGNGEPTLHPNFPELVNGIIQVRNRFSPKSKTAILSNSSQIMKVPIREALSRLDVKIMKFECGNDRIFYRYNRPHGKLTVNQLVTALRSFANVTIQALFSGGSEGNYDLDFLDEWTEKIVAISPDHVQLYTLARFYPSSNIRPLNRNELLFIKQRLTQRGIDAEVYM